MKTCKQIGIFLLLGVLLVGLLLSGCAPVEQTQASTSEPDPNAIAFLDLPGVNMDDICEINIYTGDDSEPVQTISPAEEISNFLAAYETLRFHWIDTDVPPTSSEKLANFTEEYWTALEEVHRAYRIEVKLTNDPQRILTGWNFYVGTNGTVYYLDAQLSIYVSTTETDYIGTVLNN